MSIYIDEINIKNLGPVSEFDHQLGKVNLFYGKNESGKTHLVEFIIRSLFKNIHYPGLRKPAAVGQISVSGLADSAVRFSPPVKKKLEAYIDEEGKAIPTNISRLLVIRAGELSLSGNNVEGIDKPILEEYLSNAAMINRIRSSLPKTIQNASIVAGEIQGNRQSWIKDRKNAIDEINAIDALFDRINDEYASGVVASIQAELDLLSAELNQQYHAKCYLAYQRNQEIAELSKNINEIPTELLSGVNEKLHEYQNDVKDLKELEDQHASTLQACKDLPWLSAALAAYQQFLGNKSETVSFWPLMVAAIFALAALVLSFFNQPFLTAGSIAVAVGMAYFYLRKLKEVAARAVQTSELEKIRTEFEQKFARVLTDFPSFQVIHDEQNAADITAKSLESQILTKQSELSKQEQKISDQLYQITGKRLQSEEWRSVVDALLQDRKTDEQRLQQLSIELATLQVEEKNFLSQPSSTKFDKNRYIDLELRMEQLKNDKIREEEKLNSLRQRLAQETRLDISTSWVSMIEKLQQKRIRLSREYQAITAKLIAAICVNETLSQLYTEEEKSIQNGLRSPIICNFLKQMTTHYNRIEYENGKIKIADQFSEYEFGDLSTATQEQVLLALRLGISSRCFYNQNLFLVLDDAFQHSDWYRREYLVDGVLSLAEMGWQIIYLTMDDHIRELFRKKAQPKFEKGFTEIVL